MPSGSFFRLSRYCVHSALPGLTVGVHVTTLYKPRTLALGLVVALSLTDRCNAENPIIQTNFTADPAPLVYNGTVYLYTRHDEDDATGFHMLNWKLYTSTDMVNWTDHGTVASLATFPWAVQSNDAWAPQAIERNGKFYLYVPISVPGSPKNVIAVAVADSPFWPVQGYARASADRQRRWGTSIRLFSSTTTDRHTFTGATRICGT